ncbi:MAG: hypothetical protein ACREAF_03115 [Nitrosopumilaceae archaeon]
MKKKTSKSKKGTYIAIIVGIIIIGFAVAFNYSLDQAKLAGERFGKNLEQIQIDLKKQVSDYESKITLYQEGSLTKQEILEISENHLAELENLVARYDTLLPPQAFAPSLELFKLSAQSQLESDRLLKAWIETGNNLTKIRSDELLQQSFEYETSALASFNKAKKGNAP